MGRVDSRGIGTAAISGGDDRVGGGSGGDGAAGARRGGLEAGELTRTSKTWEERDGEGEEG